MKWNYTYSKLEKIGNELLCWEECSFLTITKNYFKMLPGLYKSHYDGIPYKILSLWLFCINWGKTGDYITPIKRKN